MDKLTRAIMRIAESDRQYHNNLVYRLLVDYRENRNRAKLPGRTARFFKPFKFNTLQFIKRLNYKLSGHFFPIF